MGLQTPADMSIAYLVLDIACDDAAKEKKHAGIACVEQRKALPGVFVAQHLQGRGTRDKGVAEDLVVPPCQQPHTRENDDQVTGKRGDLAAADLGDGNGQVIQVRLM